MSGTDAATAAAPHLLVRLGVEADGLRVVAVPVPQWGRGNDNPDNLTGAAGVDRGVRRGSR